MQQSASLSSSDHAACHTPDVLVASAESEDSDVNHTPATSNVGADIKLLISPSGFLRLNDAVNTPSRSVPNKSAELPRR